MNRRIFFGMVLILCLFLSISGDSFNYSNTINSPEVDQTTHPEFSDYQVSDARNRYDYTLDIHFLGINDSRVNSNQLDLELPKWQAPVIKNQVITSPTIDIENNISISYNFIFHPVSIVEDYHQFLLSNGSKNKAPYYIQPEYNSSIFINSISAENYLLELLNIGNNDPSIIIIDTYSFSPQDYQPYYYNSTMADIDSNFPVNRYLSQNKILGGGSNSSTAWIDLSAGPTKYKDSDPFGKYGVNESLITPIWDYYNKSDPVGSLTSDLSYYISTGIENLFLPSKNHMMQNLNRNVLLDINIIDLTSDLINISNQYFPERIVTQLNRLNPYISWTIDHQIIQDNKLLDQISDSFNSSLNKYNLSSILSTLDSTYENYVVTSNSSHTVIPYFILGFESDRELIGPNSYIQNISEDMGYVLTMINENNVISNYTLVNDTWINETIQINSTSPLIIQNIGGFVDDIFKGNLSSSEPVNFTILDQFNYEQKLDNNEFEHVVFIQNSVNQVSFNFTSTQVQNYSIIIETNSSSNIVSNISISHLERSSHGYSYDILYLLLKKFGRINIAEGFTWHGNQFVPEKSFYLNFLWEMTNSIYIKNNRLPYYSNLDINIFRSQLFNGLITEYKIGLEGILSEYQANHKYVPSSIIDIVDQIFEGYEIINQISNFNSVVSNDTIFEMIYESISIIQQLGGSSNSFNFDHEFEFISNDQITVRYELYIASSLIDNRTIFGSQFVTIEDIGWYDYELTIYHNGSMLTTFEGFTWNMVQYINLISLIESGTNSIPENRTDPDLTGSKVDVGGNQNGFLHYSLFISLIPLILIIRFKSNE